MSTDGIDDGEDLQINLTSRDDSEQTSPCGSSEHEGTFTLFDAMFFIVGMALYIADLVTDLVVGVQYFRRGDLLWSIMTFVFVFVPSIILQYFSFRWYILDMKEEKRDELKALTKISAWCQWLATHVLQLGAIKRYWRTVKYGLRSRHDYTYYNLMIFEYRDISMLRLQEAFMESAPQLVLQVYIMLESKEFHWLTATSALVSLSSLAFSLETYHKVLRASRKDRLNISYSGVTMRILWRLFTITARVLSMALFASIFEWWLFIVAGGHWVVMTAWLKWQKTQFHDAMYDEIPFIAVIGIIHIFCFFNMKEGHTRYRALAFYTVVFIENTIMLALWYGEQESKEEIYAIPALGFVWGGFFVGLLIMSLYYISCHPTGDIPFCIPSPWSKEAVSGENTESRDVILNLQGRASERSSIEKLPELPERKRHRYFFSPKWSRHETPMPAVHDESHA